MLYRSTDRNRRDYLTNAGVVTHLQVGEQEIAFVVLVNGGSALVSQYSPQSIDPVRTTGERDLEVLNRNGVGIASL